MSDSPSSPRQAYEAHQRRWLVPYAVAEADAGGRAHAEDEHPYRTCFQRDRDRIVHCSAFRRLDFKTQVFVPHENDHFRTRLTHTLEVAQVGRSLGRVLRLNEDLIEAVALAHDLGHPPFGHAGEEALDEMMAGAGHFEHNRQSLRIVDYLEHPYPRFRGLNLTRAVRHCLATHRTRYDTPTSDEFDPAEPAPLEGQVVDLADEIAYTSADLEDSLAAGLIDMADLDDLSLWRLAWQTTQAEAPDARPIHKRIRACKAVLAAMADDLVATTAALANASPRPADGRVVSFSASLAGEVHQLQDFLARRVYLAGPAAEQSRRSKQIIRHLFETYLADPRQLPARYGRRIETDGIERVICDYIAGMTDRFCRQEYARIAGQTPPE